MAKKKRGFAGGLRSSNVVRDPEWMTIIGSLLHDKTPESRQLANALLAKTRHGRHVRVLRLICKSKPTLTQMQQLTKMSRRTIFRYLNSLEGYGVRFKVTDDYGYTIEHMPAFLKRVL